MPTAPNNLALKKRLDRYFWSNNTGEMVFLRRLLDKHFTSFDHIAVIGGLVRDFAREGRSGFHSDIDLVIDASQESVATLAALLNATPNRFGGFGCKQGPWKIDFWALETTWARKHVPIESLQDIVSCTFFDWDAIAYDLNKRKLICPENYLSRIRNKILDINLFPNPSPLGNLVRAVRRLVIWEAQSGPLLRQFIHEHLDDSALRFIQSKEVELYTYAVSKRWKTADEAKKAIFSIASGRNGAQYELSLD
jgi:hypothetical protein